MPYKRIWFSHAYSFFCYVSRLPFAALSDSRSILCHSCRSSFLTLVISTPQKVVSVIYQAHCHCRSSCQRSIVNKCTTAIATGLAASHICNNTCISLICIWSCQIKYRSNKTPLKPKWATEEEQWNRQMQWLSLKHQPLHVQYVKQIVKIVTILWETYPQWLFLACSGLRV